MNTGAKYDSRVFKKSVGLNGVGIKAVNALSSSLLLNHTGRSDGRLAEFPGENCWPKGTGIINGENNGTRVVFTPDNEIFGKFRFIPEYLERMFRNYVYLNTGTHHYV
jgi:topoisomerase IV subunit B